MKRKVRLPLTDSVIEELRAGDSVLLTGPMLVARDAAHRRMIEILDAGGKLPFDITGETVYYMGPSPAPPGKVTGSAGPTTSGRMDTFTPRLIEQGLKGMVGKGMRSSDVISAMIKHKAVYFAAIGGAGALISQTIKKAEVIAWEDLGAEAVRRIDVEDFPAVVANDIYGGDLFRDSKAAWRKVSEGE
jgi:fumarate hydratase subunit beta